MKTKFRAWHTHKQIMCEVIRIDFEREIVTLDLETDDDEYYWMETDWSFSDVEIVQSTGLKDNLGNEIFEGDILRVISFEDNDAFEGKVNFESGAFCLRIKSDDKSWKLPLIGIQEYSSNFHVNVLGNIYEDLELIDVEPYLNESEERE